MWERIHFQTYLCWCWIHYPCNCRRSVSPLCQSRQSFSWPFFPYHDSHVFTSNRVAHRFMSLRISLFTVCLTWARECSLFWRASVVIRPVQWRKTSHYKVFSLNSTFRGLIARQHIHRPRGLWCGYHLLLCLSRWQFKSTQELVLCVFLLSCLWDFFLFVCILDMLDCGIKCFFVYTTQAQNCLLLSFSPSFFF